MSNDTSYVSQEIGLQPQAWAEAQELLAELAGQLPQPGERVAVIGCGTSWFMAAAYASLREIGGRRRDRRLRRQPVADRPAL